MSSIIGSGLINLLVASLDQAPVVLGAVVLLGHEVPSRISLGGAQAVTIHRLPGGSRIIDAMGVDDGSISLSGYFTGPGAASRARLFDSIRKAGQVVPLSFGDYAFNVVVVHFEYDLQDRGALISYRIRMEIIPDNITQLNDTSDALAALLSGDVSAASAALLGFGSVAAQVSLADLQTALPTAGSPNSAFAVSTITATLAASASAVRSGIISSGGLLQSNSVSDASGALTASALNAMVNAAGDHGAYVMAAGYVNRSSNWVNELSGQPPGAPLVFA